MIPFNQINTSNPSEVSNQISARYLALQQGPGDPGTLLIEIYNLTCLDNN